MEGIEEGIEEAKPLVVDMKTANGQAPLQASHGNAVDIPGFGMVEPEDMEVEEPTEDVDMSDIAHQGQNIVEQLPDVEDISMETDGHEQGPSIIFDEQGPSHTVNEQPDGSTDVTMSEPQQLAPMPQELQALEAQKERDTLQQTFQTQPAQQDPQLPGACQAKKSGRSWLKRKSENDTQDEPAQKVAKSSARQLVKKPKPAWFSSPPTPGPSQRRIFRVKNDRPIGYGLIEKPQPLKNVCIDGTASWGTSLKTEASKKRLCDTHDVNERGFCTVDILDRAFARCFGEDKIGYIKSIVESIVRGEITTLPDEEQWEHKGSEAAEKVGISQFQQIEMNQFHHAITFEHRVPDLDDARIPKVFTTCVSANGDLRRAPVTTFSNFLRERRCRASGNGPWSAHDGVQLIMEFLVLRMPMSLVSTHEVLSFLEGRLGRYLDAEIHQHVLQTGIGAGHEPHKSLLAIRAGNPRDRLYSRSYATHLYKHLQQRVFLWALRAEPVKHKVVCTRTLRGWAKDVTAECRWYKDGRWHDLWRLVRRDEKGNVVLGGDGKPADAFADWTAGEPPRTGEQLRRWFVAWLDRFVTPKLGRLGGIMECPDAGLRNRWLRGCWEVMHQQMDVDITNWLRDFPGWGADERGAARARTGGSALDEIIRQASGRGR